MSRHSHTSRAAAPRSVSRMPLLALDLLQIALASRSVAHSHASLRIKQMDRLQRRNASMRETERQLRLIGQGIGAAVALSRRFMADGMERNADGNQRAESRDWARREKREVRFETWDPDFATAAMKNREARHTENCREESVLEIQSNLQSKSQSHEAQAQSQTELTIHVQQEPSQQPQPIPTLDTRSHEQQQPPPPQMKESRVPATRLGRLWEYSGLATSMAFGAVGESLRRANGSTASGSIMLSPKNIERLVSKLSTMRGAALKLGQMISFQDSKLMPPAIVAVLQRVQDRADYMPSFQRDKVLSANLGTNWRDLFLDFGELPIAAASIGQVHHAVLKSTGKPVAVKIQYPGVAQSIDSDLNNLSILLTASGLLLKGLFLDRTIANARTELAWECDYEREAAATKRFRTLLKDDTVFIVPAVIPEASGKQVLTTEYMDGKAVAKLTDVTSQERDWIGTQILRLCLREITEFGYMQTDPNWTNFLYSNKKIQLLDFGASREYAAKFIDAYVGILRAAACNDANAVAALSIKLGYLTGHESAAMLEAHVNTVITLAEPFSNEHNTNGEPYQFSGQTITDRVRGLIPTMVNQRLVPPPEETYSLHRKLSGVFLLCARLGSSVDCKALFATAMNKYDEKRKGVNGILK